MLLATLGWFSNVMGSEMSKEERYFMWWHWKDKVTRSCLHLPLLKSESRAYRELLHAQEREQQAFYRPNQQLLVSTNAYNGNSAAHDSEKRETTIDMTWYP